MVWGKVKLENILHRKRETIKITPDSDYKLVTIRLHHKGVVLREIRKGNTIKSPMSKVHTGDFVLSGIDARNGAFGIVPLELDNALITNDFWCLEPNKEVIKKEFLLFITSTEYFDYICNQSSDGTTQRIRLQKDKFFNYEIDIPPLNEQDKILDKLTNQKSLSGAINSEQLHQLALLKKIRQQILQDAVQGKLVPQDPIDEPASNLLEKIKAEKEELIRQKKIKKEKSLPEIKPEQAPFEIPENWVWCRLGEITNYGSSPKAEPCDITNETWVLDLEDIEKETSRLLCKVRFSDRKSLSTKSVFKMGEVLYSKLRPYLDKVIVADENGVCTTEILPLHCYASLNPYYLRIALKRKDFIFYVNSLTKGMKMPRLGTPDGKSAFVPLCPVTEQHRIVVKVEQLIKLCDELEQSILQNQTYTQELLKVTLKEALEPKN